MCATMCHPSGVLHFIYTQKLSLPSRAGLTLGAPPALHLQLCCPGIMASNGIVQKLWNYCNLLRDDGLRSEERVVRLECRLCFKMADEQKRLGQARPTRHQMTNPHPSCQSASDRTARAMAIKRKQSTI